MAIITVPADSGNGGGFSIAQGALVPTVNSGTPIVTNMTTEHMLNNDYDSQSVSNEPGTHGHGWNGLCGETGSPFAFHTGHSNNFNSSDWPMYAAIKVSDHFRGTVVNRIYWSKHTNACGNADIWGTMKQKMSNAMDMRFNWLKNRVNEQQQFEIFWDKGIHQLADYPTKHHPGPHH